MMNLNLLNEKKGLIIAVILAALAAILVVVWLKQQQEQLRQKNTRELEAFQASTVEGIFAKDNIPAGKLISEDMLFTRYVTKSSLPAAAATSIARVVGRVPTDPIRKDALVMIDRLTWPTTKETTLSSKTPVGKRAIQIKAENIASLVNMIKPGDYVDVMAEVPIPVMVDGKQQIQAGKMSLFQNVLILAVGSDIGGAAEDESAAPARRRSGGASVKEAAPLITLALNPEEANILAFVIGQQSKVELVLRSPGDARTEPLQPITWEHVLKYLFPNIELEAKEETKAEVKELPKVEIIRGFSRETVAITTKK